MDLSKKLQKFIDALPVGASRAISARDLRERLGPHSWAILTREAQANGIPVIHRRFGLYYIAETQEELEGALTRMLGELHDLRVMFQRLRKVDVEEYHESRHST
jgi:hypothetical protein